MKSPSSDTCWLCGKQLWRDVYTELHVDHQPRILHKSCARTIKKGLDYRRWGDEWFSLECNVGWEE